MVDKYSSKQDIVDELIMFIFNSQPRAEIYNNTLIKKYGREPQTEEDMFTWFDKTINNNELGIYVQDAEILELNELYLILADDKYKLIKELNIE
jgi:hypothetical protein